jgi:hypothetical protein
MQQTFPTEIWITIAHYLDGITLRKFSKLNKQCNKVSKENKIWENLCLRNGYTIKSQLIQDLKSFINLSSDITMIDWRKVFIQNYRQNERNSIIDFLTKKVSEETLFNLQRISYLENCPQCLIDDEKCHVGNMIQHSLQADCYWSRSVKEYKKIPQCFILKKEDWEVDLGDFKQLLYIGQ